MCLSSTYCVLWFRNPTTILWYSYLLVGVSVQVSHVLVTYVGSAEPARRLRAEGGSGGIRSFLCVFRFLTRGCVRKCLRLNLHGLVDSSADVVVG